MMLPTWISTRMRGFQAPAQERREVSHFMLRRIALESAPVRPPQDEVLSLTGTDLPPPLQEAVQAVWPEGAPATTITLRIQSQAERAGSLHTVTPESTFRRKFIFWTVEVLPEDPTATTFLTLDRDLVELSRADVPGARTLLQLVLRHELRHLRFRAGGPVPTGLEAQREELEVTLETLQEFRALPAPEQTAVLAFLESPHHLYDGAETATTLRLYAAGHTRDALRGMIRALTDPKTAPPVERRSAWHALITNQFDPDDHDTLPLSPDLREALTWEVLHRNESYNGKIPDRAARWLLIGGGVTLEDIRFLLRHSDERIRDHAAKNVALSRQAPLYAQLNPEDLAFVRLREDRSIPGMHLLGAPAVPALFLALTEHAHGDRALDELQQLTSDEAARAGIPFLTSDRSDQRTAAYDLLHGHDALLPELTPEQRASFDVLHLLRQLNFAAHPDRYAGKSVPPPELERASGSVRMDLILSPDLDPRAAAQLLSQQPALAEAHAVAYAAHWLKTSLADTINALREKSRNPKVSAALQRHAAVLLSLVTNDVGPTALPGVDGSMLWDLVPTAMLPSVHAALASGSEARVLRLLIQHPMLRPAFAGFTQLRYHNLTPALLARILAEYPLWLRAVDLDQLQARSWSRTVYLATLQDIPHNQAPYSVIVDALLALTDNMAETRDFLLPGPRALAEDLVIMRTLVQQPFWSARSSRAEINLAPYLIAHILTQLGSDIQSQWGDEIQRLASGLLNLAMQFPMSHGDPTLQKSVRDLLAKLERTNPDSARQTLLRGSHEPDQRGSLLRAVKFNPTPESELLRAAS